MFPDHLISLRGEIGWPTRSTDLNHHVFSLWLYFTSKLCINRLVSLNSLKMVFGTKFTSLRKKFYRRLMAIDKYGNRFQKCEDNNGFHLTNLIFKANGSK